MSQAIVLKERTFKVNDAELPVALVTTDQNRESDVAVPLARLAQALEVSRQVIHQTVGRDDVLKEYLVNATLTTGATTRPTAFLLRPGVLGAMLKLSARRIQDPAKRERIKAFQRWAFEHLDRTMFGPAPAPQPPRFAPAVGRRCKGRICISPLAPEINQMITGQVRKPEGALYTYAEIVIWAAERGLKTSEAALSRHKTAHLGAVVHPEDLAQRALRELAQRDLSELSAAEVLRIGELGARLSTLDLGKGQWGMIA